MTSTPGGRRRRWRHAWDVVVVLVDRDLKALYKRSWLGLGWALVVPLIQLAVYSLVFRRVLAVQVENYAAFAFLGVLVWGWFQSAVSQSTSLVTANQALVKQPGFPLHVLPLVSVGVRFIHFVVALPLLVAFLLWHGLRPGPAWVAVPLVAGVEFLLIAALAFPLAAINVRLRDTQHLVAAGLQLAMFVTPVYYSLETVPPRLRGWFAANPMAILLEAWRAVLLRNTWPDFGSLLGLAGAAGILLVIGMSVFSAWRYRFVDEL
ncbi:MAG: ABC transporter permease [Gemmatimonadales bacterium]